MIVEGVAVMTGLVIVQGHWVLLARVEEWEDHQGCGSIEGK
jgi:hypothetical protein